MAKYLTPVIFPERTRDETLEPHTKRKPFHPRKLQTSHDGPKGNGLWSLPVTYIIPRKGEIMETSIAHAPVLNRLLTIKGRKRLSGQNITFRNLSF